LSSKSSFAKKKYKRSNRTIFVFDKMKHRGSLFIVLGCVAVLSVASVLTVVLLIQTYECPPNALDIATFGDSLTDVGNYGHTVACGSLYTFGYQRYIFETLLQNTINSRVRNFGIGGQTSFQIAHRVTHNLSTDVLTFFMGVNDIHTWDPSKNDTVTSQVAFALSQGRPTVRRGVLVATIPPHCQGYPFARPEAVDAMNAEIWRNFSATSIIDLYSALVIPGTSWRHPAYCLGDLVHFTEAANAVVGYMFAQAILKMPHQQQQQQQPRGAAAAAGAACI
jgi:lysophospholipase L1-like esterase